MARKANKMHPQTEKSVRNVQLSPRGQRWPKFISQPIEPAFSKYRIRHVEPDILIRVLFQQKNTFWISVSGLKLTIRPDIHPANRIVIISGMDTSPRQFHESAIGQHLLDNAQCALHFNKDKFSVLARARTPFHLSSPEATFIKSLNPLLCKQKEFVYSLKIS